MFALFLSSRRSWIKTHLKAASAKAASSSSSSAASDVAPLVASGLQRVVEIIQTSLCHAGELFLEVSSSHRPLFFESVLSAPPESQLFGGIPNPSRERQLWKQHREQLQSAMEPLTSKGVAAACRDWLLDCARDIAEEAQPLLSLIPHLSSLASIHSALLVSICDRSVFSNSMPWLAAAFGSPPDLPWDAICELLLKEPRDLWADLFQGLFLQRAKAIVDASLSSLDISQLLHEALERTEGKPEQDFVRSQWSDEEGEAWAMWEVAKRKEKDLLSLTSVSHFTAEVTALKDLVDGKLQSIVVDIQTLLSSSSQPPSSSASPSSASSLSSSPAVAAAAAAATTIDTAHYSQHLSPYFQQKVVEKMGAIAALLSSRLKSVLGADENGDADAAAAEAPAANSLAVQRALLIGRLCAAIGQFSPSLAAALGPPSSWPHFVSALGGGVAASGSVREANSFSARGRRGSEGYLAEMSTRRLPRRGSTEFWGQAKGADEFSRLRALQKELRLIRVRAFRVWAEWTARQLAAFFERHLAGDESLATTVPLKGWEETVVRSDDDGDAAVELRMTLPAQPSVSCLSLLFAACRHLQLVAGPAADRAVQRFLACRLMEELLIIYERFAAGLDSSPSSSSPSVSEKGILQLLFDVRLAADVLAGGADISIEAIASGTDDEQQSSSSATSAPGGRYSTILRPRSGYVADAASLARKKRVQNLLERLQNRLDPIDWATYEAYLWQNEQRFYHRSSVLLGPLMQLLRLYSDQPAAATRQPFSSDCNTMHIAPPAPRFTYLPISTPLISASNNHAAARGRRLSSAFDASSLQSPGGRVLPDSDAQNGTVFDGAKFLFGDAAISNTAMMKSLMGQVKFGSILTDGASMGRISSFQDMLPSQATNLFSSFGGTT